jgi:hypothetical protein
LHDDSGLLFEHVSDVMEVGQGWEFGNFYPYFDNIAPGNYVFRSYIDLGDGFMELAEIPFTVNKHAGEFIYSHSVTATDFAHGTGHEHWNLRPLDPRNTFKPGETVYVFSQIRNVEVDHRWKAELYRNDMFLWEHANGVLRVGEGWDYGNFFPFYQNAQPGEYTWVIYIDTGEGYMLLDEVPFTVEGPNTDLFYAGAVTASDWHHGPEGTDEYWDLQPIDPKTVFKAGERVYLLAQIKNVYVDHRWKLETYGDGRLLWDHVTDVVDVGNGFFYSNYQPFYGNPTPGNYTYKLYIDTGSGFEQIDELDFRVI